jgi:hypothetical protein
VACPHAARATATSYFASVEEINDQGRPIGLADSLIEGV